MPREQFFSVPSLLVMGALMAFVLYMLFPRQAIFEDSNYLDNPDGLSIAYLDVLLQSDPDNNALRMNFARMLGQVGQIRRAEQVLAPLLATSPVPPMAFDNYLHLLAQQQFSLPAGPDRDALQTKLFINAMKILKQNYPFDQKQKLLEPTTAWLTPKQTMAVLQSLLVQAPDPEQRLSLARQLARYQESRGNPKAAARTLQDHLALTYTTDGASLIAEIIRLQLASDQPGEALTTFRTYLANDRMGETGLRQGIKLARLAGASAQARQWLGRLARQEPDNLPLQRQLLDAQLADNRLKPALATVKRLQRYSDRLTKTDRRRIAQVLEWNQQPKAALDEWQVLYQHTGDRQAYDRALTLASELLRWPELIQILESGRRAGAFSAAEYEQLADALVREGHIRTARQRLQEGLKQYPGSSRLIQRELLLALNTRDFSSAIALLERQNNLSATQKIELANLYWRTRQPKRALAVLNFEPEDPELARTVQIMQIDLGLLLGDTDALKKHYDQLKNVGAIDDPQLQERLLNLAGLFGDYRRALILSKARFDQTGDLRYLAAMADYQLTLKAWPGLASSLKQWRARVPESRQSERYWTLSALLYQHQGNIPAADSAFRRAFSLAPENEDILVSWAWFQLAHRERYDNTLPSLLARLARQPGEATYPVLAYGYSALNQPWVARYWFSQGLDAHQNDPDWIAATAQIMQRTGDAREANRLWARLSALGTSVTVNPETRLALYQARSLNRLADLAIRRYQPTQGSADNGLAEALANQALSRNNAQTAESLLGAMAPEAAARVAGALRPRPETRTSRAHRLTTQLDTLSTSTDPDTHQTMLRDTVDLHRNFARSLQIGADWQNLGNFSILSRGVRGTTSTDTVNIEAQVQSLQAYGRGRLRVTPRVGTESMIAFSGGDLPFQWRLNARHLPRYQTTDLATGAEGSWQADDSVTLNAGLSLSERTPDSAEAWWLTRRNRLSLGATYTPFSRLTVSTQLKHFTVDNLQGRRLGMGNGFDLNGSYALWRSDPAWTVSASYSNQQLTPVGHLPGATLAALDRPLVIGDLLARRYERVGVSSRWFHGELHELFRSTPSPQAFVDVNAGYVLSTSTPDMGVALGLGWRVLGDDELALSGNWLSGGVDGKGRTSLNLDYTVYFGR